MKISAARNVILVLILCSLVATLAIYLSLPKISGKLLESALAKAGFVDIQIEQETLGLTQAKFQTIKARRAIGGHYIRAALRNVTASYSYASLAKNSIGKIEANEAEIEIEGLNSPIGNTLNLSQLVIDLDSESAVVSVVWAPEIAKDLRKILFDQPLNLGNQIITTAELLPPERVEFELKIRQQPKIEVSGTASGSVGANLANSKKLKIFEGELAEIKFQYDGTELQLNSQITINEKIKVKANARVSPEKSAGKLVYQLDRPLKFTNKPFLANTFPNLLLPLDFVAGELNFHGTLSFQSSNHGLKLENESIFSANELNGTFEQFAFMGLNSECSYQLKSQTHRIACPANSLNKLDIGFPLSNLRLGFQFEKNAKASSASGQNFSADLLNGNISSKELKLDFSEKIKSVGPILLEVKKIDLQSLLKLKSNEEFSATGEIDGSIPVTIEVSGFRVRDGHLDARGAGVLRYKPSNPNIASYNSAIAMATEALSNFHYSQLKSKMNYDPDGLMHLAINLQGKNPDFKSGQAFNFNINIDENILALIRSMTIANDFEKSIDQSVERNERQKNKK